MRRWWAPLVMGIVSICLGILLLSHPAETSIWIAWLVGIFWFIGGIAGLALPWVFAIFAIAGGIAAIVMAFKLKKA